MCPKTPEEVEAMRDVPYREAVGKLIYLTTCTRPDIAYAVGAVSRFMANPGQEHWKTVKHIMRYLKRTPTRGIQYGGANADLVLRGFSDADWGGDIDTRRSTSGLVFTLGGGPITWRSNRQRSVALSSMEAEYMALCDAAQEAVWGGRLLGDLGVPPEDAIEIGTDNFAAEQFAKDHKFHGRAKHIAIKYHFVRERVSDKAITVYRVPGVEMIADVFTKADIPRNRFEHLVVKMGMR
jgi:hypothetical protein